MYTPLYDKVHGLPEYPLAQLIKAFVPFFGQSAKRGAHSTLYASTDPGLTGDES